MVEEIIERAMTEAVTSIPHSASLSRYSNPPERRMMKMVERLANSDEEIRILPLSSILSEVKVVARRKEMENMRRVR